MHSTNGKNTFLQKYKVLSTILCSNLLFCAQSMLTKCNKARKHSKIGYCSWLNVFTRFRFGKQSHWRSNNTKIPTQALLHSLFIMLTQSRYYSNWSLNTVFNGTIIHYSCFFFKYDSWQSFNPLKCSTNFNNKITYTILTLIISLL